jgi:hypothetical protein
MTWKAVLINSDTHSAAEVFCHSHFFAPTPSIKPFLVEKPQDQSTYLSILATMMVTPPPNDFLCPLSKTIMQEPVSTPSGVNYERAAIEGWLCELSYCPVHGTPLTAQSLQANTSLQWKIRYWQKKNSTTAETTVSAQHLSLSTPDGTKKSTTPLQRFLCPLTGEIMQDPVLSKTGYSFERVTLLKWLSLRGNVCPVSGKPLKLSHVVSHCTLKREIQFWKQEQQQQQQQQDTTTTLYSQQDMKLQVPGVVPQLALLTKSPENSTTTTTASASTMSESYNPPRMLVPPKTASDAVKSTFLPRGISVSSVAIKDLLRTIQLPLSQKNSNKHVKNDETLEWNNTHIMDDTILDWLREVELTLKE